MKPIEMDIWRPKEDDPRYSEYVGQRSAEEVFRELEQHLDSMGMLPDEYFLLDRDWQDGRLIPKDADIFVTAINAIKATRSVKRLFSMKMRSNSPLSKC